MSDKPSSRRRSGRSARRALALSAVGVLALSGCGLDLHPGAAATINGTVLAQDDVDDLVSSLCSYIDVANAGSASPQQYGVAELRATVTAALISFDLLDEAAADLGLTIEPADVDALAAQNQIPDSLSATDSERVTDFFHDGAESQVTQETIGAHLKDETVTSSSDASSTDVNASSDYVTDYFAKQDIIVSPQYGTWDGSVVNQGSGSLSDAVSPAATAAVPRSDGSTDVSGLPDSQVCG